MNTDFSQVLLLCLLIPVMILIGVFGMRLKDLYVKQGIKFFDYLAARESQSTNTILWRLGFRAAGIILMILGILGILAVLFVAISASLELK